MFFIRAGTHHACCSRVGHLRNLGGIGGADLYRHSYVGTKTVVEEYVCEVVVQLHRIADSQCEDAHSGDPSSEAGIDHLTKVEFFSELLQSFGRTVLILHGGASFGLCHLGVVRALYNTGMLPKIICGSYIGALVASLFCVQEPARLGEILTGEGINFDAFYRTGSKGSFRRKLTRLLKYGRLFDIRVLEQCAHNNIGDITFKEAYLKSGLVLNITVYAKRKHEVPVLLNYLTSPDLIIWTAACASCATPGIYEQVMLLAKGEDGSIYPWHPSGTPATLSPSRLTVRSRQARVGPHGPGGTCEAPHRALQRQQLYRLPGALLPDLATSPLRALPQLDPLEPLLSRRPGALPPLQPGTCPPRAPRPSPCSQFKEFGLVPAFLMNIINLLKAPLVGDVQITPTIYCSDIQYLLSNPDPAFVKYCIQKGEVAAWRRHAHVEMRSTIEFAIEDILAKLRAQPQPHTSLGARISY